jgi:hypothetical protein
VFTQLRVRDDHSMLLNNLVDRIEVMHPMEQFTLALTHFEEAKASQLADVLGLNDKSAISPRVRAARHRVLALALNEVSSKLYEVGDPAGRFIAHEDAAEAWTQRVYGKTLREYVHAVAAYYRLDVGYLRDIIECANGRIIRNGHNGGGPNLTTRKLTDSQVREIRTRRAAGESLNSIAASFGVTRPAIGYIIQGKTYADVA